MKQLGEKVDFDVFTPTRYVMKKYHGEFRKIEEKCIPGYLFVKTDKPKDLFFDLYWTPEYTKLLGGEGLTYNSCSVSSYEARMVDILFGINNHRKMELSDIKVVEGQKIKVIASPLMGIESAIKK